MINDIWMAELKGNQNDLECLKHWFASDSAKVINQNERWFLAGTFLLGCNTHDEVTQRSVAKLELMTAAALIESASEHLQVEVIGTAYIDQHGNQSFHRKIEAISRAVFSVRCLDGGTPSLPNRALIIAESDQHLDMALRLWGEPSRSWPRLYRIVEDISLSLVERTSGRYYISQVLLNEGLIPSLDDCRRFIYSACEATVAGRDSRHALGNNQSATEYEPMTHPQAVRFVGSLLSKALRKKWEGMEDSTAPAVDAG